MMINFSQASQCWHQPAIIASLLFIGLALTRGKRRSTFERRISAMGAAGGCVGLLIAVIRQMFRSNVH